MIRKITDTGDTGEIFNIRKIQYNIFDEEKGYLFRAKNFNIKQYQDFKLSNVVKDDSDFCKIHKLAEHIYKDTNTICIRISNRRVRVADIEDISKIINLSHKRTRDFITRMKKLHIIAERVDNVGDMISTKFVFNPLIFSSNKYLSADLYFLFQESLDCYLPGWVTKRFHEYGNIKNDI